MDHLIYAPLFIILIAAGAVYFLRHHAREPIQPALPLVARPVLTNHELAFIQKLAEAAAEFDGIHVFPQVSLGAFLAVKAGTPKALRTATLNRILKKRCDFALVDSTSRVQLIVELDDRTHNADTDAARDELAAAAGIKTLRLTNGNKITVADIVTALRPHLPAA